MNASTQMQAQRIYETFQHPRRVICGVCAWASAESGVPAWIIRVVAVCMLLAHAALATIAYLVAAYCIRRTERGGWRGTSRAAAPSWDRDGLVNRFDRLDGRLSHMERETLDREAALRRAFHDLDR